MPHRQWLATAKPKRLKQRTRARTEGPKRVPGVKKGERLLNFCEC